MSSYFLAYNNNLVLDENKIFIPSIKEDNPEVEFLLHPVNGSDGIHFYIQLDDLIVKQKHFKCRSGEIITIKLKRSPEKHSNIVILSSNRQVIQLPNDSLYSPFNQTFLVSESEKLDVLFIIDATMLNSSLDEFKKENKKTLFLLDSDTFKTALAAKIDKFIDSISASKENIQCSFLSFADTEIKGISSSDLKPKYILDPAKVTDRYFSSWDKNIVSHHLNQITTSSGGDYIDALADALHAAQNYHWRENTRRLVFIIGDSPGFSLLNPAPVIGGIQANAALRHHDIDSEVMNLHKNKIEVMSLYITDKRQLHRSESDRDKLKAYTKQQYSRLASMEKYAYSWSNWKPEEAAKTFQQSKQLLLGRGYCYPMIKEDNEEQTL